MALSQEIYTSPAFIPGLKNFIFTEDELCGSKAPANVAWAYYRDVMEDLSNLLTEFHSQVTTVLYAELASIDTGLRKTRYS